MSSASSDLVGRGRGALGLVLDWEERHPYSFSFIFSCVVSLYIVFTDYTIEMTDRNIVPSDNIEFINIEDVTNMVSKRVAPSRMSVAKGEVDYSNTEVERASGFSDDPNAVDIAFHPNVVPPKPIGKIEKRYPKIASELGVESMLNVELLIASNGMVKSVRVLAIFISKPLPPDQHAIVARAFARNAVDIMKNVRFTPPVVGGRFVPVKMEIPLNFRLQE
jgi:hypothetical protein